MLAILSPGQGSQSPEFLGSWLEDPSLSDLLGSWSEQIGVDLARLGTTAGADEIRDTANAQPLIVAGGFLAIAALGRDARFDISAGHSVGEITASSIAGIFSRDSAMALVCERGKVMAVAAGQSKSGMSAVLGGQREEVLATIATLGLIPANDNGAGQIVAAGDLTALEQLGQNPPDGARVRALTVAGAFHTYYMQPALEQLSKFASTILVEKPAIPLLSNKDGQVIVDGAKGLNRIVNQIANPVRWDLCMKTLADLGVSAVLEIPPAGTLVGLIKRALPGVETLALKSLDDIDAARDLITRHSGKISTS